jgi:AraC-like DNA-binding protein
MGKTHEMLRQTHTHGDGTREWLITLGTEPLLPAYGLHAVGWAEADIGYNFTYPEAREPLLYFSLKGSGEVWIEGKWQPFPAGTAFLSPRKTPRGYRAVAGMPWQTCWILFRDDTVITDPLPRLITASGHLVHLAIQGCVHEHQEHNDRTQMEYWVQLIDGYARRIGGRHGDGSSPPRLREVWEKVSADLAAGWTVQRLAKIASLSEESIRRLSLLETKRTPMEHVTHLRMRTAASLLILHPFSVAEVALRVGYANAFAFSTAFKREFGVSPAQYRRRLFEFENDKPV